jgi:mRNA interferase YafQ
MLKRLRRFTPDARELKAHPLKQGWKHYRDIHIEPDWVFYKVDDKNLRLILTGPRANLFGG